MRIERSVSGRRFLRLARDRRGVAALEFALIGPILITMVLGVTEVAFDFYVQQEMDYATGEAAREIQTGAVQSNANVTSSASFQTNVMCPIMSPLLSCNNMLVNVTGVSSFAGTQPTSVPVNPGTKTVNTASSKYCSASGSQLILVQAIYFAPVWVSWFLPWVVTFNGATTLPLFSTSAFATEPFPPSNTNYASTPPSSCS